MHKKAATDPGKELHLYSRIGMYNEAVLSFFNQDGSDYDLAAVGLEIGVKRNRGEDDFVTLTEGGGITVTGNDVSFVFTEAQSETFTQKCYYWELRRTIDGKTKVWLNGDHDWHNGRFDSFTSGENITIDDNGVPINITINDIGTGGISGLPQTANTLYAGPTSGAAAVPTFRALVAADIPKTNGITAVGTSIGLGGVVIQDTVIDVTPNIDLFIGDAGTGYGLIVTTNAGSAGLSSPTGGIFADANGDMRVVDGRTNPDITGLQYNSDTYGADFTDASLIHKGYADGRYFNTRSISAVTTATLTPNVDDYDLFVLSAQASALLIANPTGTAVLGNGIMIDLDDNGSARAITYGNLYTSTFVTLPTTTIAGKRMKMVFQYNGTNWELLNVINEQ